MLTPSVSTSLHLRVRTRSFPLLQPVPLLSQVAECCLQVICRPCALKEEAMSPGKEGFACPICSKTCGTPAAKLELDVGTVAMLRQQQAEEAGGGGGEAAAVIDCDVCGDDPATKCVPLFFPC